MSVSCRPCFWLLRGSSLVVDSRCLRWWSLGHGSHEAVRPRLDTARSLCPSTIESLSCHASCRASPLCSIFFFSLTSYLALSRCLASSFSLLLLSYSITLYPVVTATTGWKGAPCAIPLPLLAACRVCMNMLHGLAYSKFGWHILRPCLAVSSGNLLCKQICILWVVYFPFPSILYVFPGVRFPWNLTLVTFVRRGC